MGWPSEVVLARSFKKGQCVATYMIKNKTKNTVLADDCRVCRSVWSKAKGLMFTSKSYVKRHSLVFEFNRMQRNGLHMMFVFYPIDILFLDEKKRVVESKSGLKPFMLYNPRNESMYVIELPADGIKKSWTAVGDEIDW